MFRLLEADLNCIGIWDNFVKSAAFLTNRRGLHQQRNIILPNCSFHLSFRKRSGKWAATVVARNCWGKCIKIAIHSHFSFVIRTKIVLKRSKKKESTHSLTHSLTTPALVIYWHCTQISWPWPLRGTDIHTVAAIEPWLCMFSVSVFHLGAYGTIATRHRLDASRPHSVQQTGEFFKNKNKKGWGRIGHRIKTASLVPLFARERGRQAPKQFIGFSSFPPLSRDGSRLVDANLNAVGLSCWLTICWASMTVVSFYLRTEPALWRCAAEHLSSFAQKDDTLFLSIFF